MDLCILHSAHISVEMVNSIEEFKINCKISSPDKFSSEKIFNWTIGCLSTKRASTKTDDKNISI